MIRSKTINYMALFAFFSVILVGLTALTMQGENGIDQQELQKVQARTSDCALSITSIADVTGRGIYIGGETFTVRVNYTNPGDYAALAVDGILSFNGYEYLASSDPATVDVPAYSIAWQNLTITVSGNSD